MKGCDTTYSGSFLMKCAGLAGAQGHTVDLWVPVPLGVLSEFCPPHNSYTEGLTPSSTECARVCKQNKVLFSMGPQNEKGH